MTITVSGHALPASLEAALQAGAWPAVISADLLQEVFGEAPDRSGVLYNADEMLGETSRWQSEDDPAYLGLGADTLDPMCSVLIGDLGIDRPFGLDLRADPPCVRLLTLDGKWVVIAHDIAELIARLGLG